MSSQLGTQNSKKGAAPLRALRFLALIVLTMGIGIAVAYVDAAWWVGLLFAGMMAGLAGFLYFQIVLEERRRTKLEEKIDEFPAADFIQSMNKFGVETIIGGSSAFDSVEMKLRFPGNVLQKHLADAMMEGYKEGLVEEGRRLGPNNEIERGQQFKHRAARWIQEMTQGQR